MGNASKIMHMGRHGEVVIFGATSRIGRALIADLRHHHKENIYVSAVVEDKHSPRARELKESHHCHLTECNYHELGSICEAVRKADLVVLIPAMSQSGIRFSKRVLDAVKLQNRAKRLILLSSAFVTVAAEKEIDNQNIEEGENDRLLELESVEAHARNVFYETQVRVTTLRIPILLETFLFLRDSIIYAGKCVNVYEAFQRIPVICAKDVARACSEILTRPHSQVLESLYCLVSQEGIIVPNNIAEALSKTLPRPIVYQQLSESKLFRMGKERNFSELIMRDLVDNYHFLQEFDETKLFTIDFENLTGRSMTLAQEYIAQNENMYMQNTRNSLQLNLIGASDPIFVSAEKFIGQLARAATPSRLTSNASAFPRTIVCALKAQGLSSSIDNKLDNNFYDSSELQSLLRQMTEKDVIIYVPPLHFGIKKCMAILNYLIQTVKKVGAWGIVMVSSIFAGKAGNKNWAALYEMEKCLKEKLVGHVIVRLPLFMEYFKELCLERDTSPSIEEPERESVSIKEENNQREDWNLLSHSLDSSRQYLISIHDAGQLLVALAYTFPVHNGTTRTVYTDVLTMKEIERTLQRFASKGYLIDLRKIDAFSVKGTIWEAIYWPKEYLHAFLESAIILSGDPPIEQEYTFQELVSDSVVPETLEYWALKYVKGYTHAIGYRASKARRKKATSFDPVDRITGELSNNAGENGLEVSRTVKV